MQFDNVEFNGYYVSVIEKKYGTAPTSLHYWINGLIEMKRKGHVIV
jgi:hypothetical protein